ncbi:ATP-binding protein [Streptomyces sp. NPDC000983]|uniref:ATP-binding protein n=1 Tax=Streptomyces sp. NPDC000983 TaxID=3154373 RepID=UPI00333100AF
MLQLRADRFRRPLIGAGRVTRDYDPRPASVREARREVRGRLEDWGLGDREELLDTAELLVSELATNALLHTASRFTVTLSLAGGVLRCEVRDAGRRVPQVLDAGGSESGRGMFLVDALARRWGCHQDREHKTVWFEL